MYEVNKKLTLGTIAHLPAPSSKIRDHNISFNRTHTHVAKFHIEQDEVCVLIPNHQRSYVNLYYKVVILVFFLFESTKEEAMCQQLLAYSLIATTPKATERAVRLLGACPHSPQSVLLFLDTLFMQPEGTVPEGAAREGGGEGKGKGAGKWKDVIKENKEMTVECGSFTQEPILLLSLTSDPIFSPVFRHRWRQKKV